MAAPTSAAIDSLDLDLTAVASLVVMARSILLADPELQYPSGCIALWESLTGLTGEAAVDLARQIQASRVPVRAAVVPF